MIRFSHEANSWQYSDYEGVLVWVNISAKDARGWFDYLKIGSPSKDIVIV